MKNAIHYTIVPQNLAGHIFEVSVTLNSPHPEGQVFTLPA